MADENYIVTEYGFVERDNDGYAFLHLPAGTIRRNRMQTVIDFVTAWIAAHPKVAAAATALVSALVTALLADAGVTVPAP